MTRILLSAPDLRGLESSYVEAAIASGWVAPAGPDLEAFESEISEWVDGRHAVGLSSGTAALHLALYTSGVRAGDDVLCSTLTFVATANAILQVGANPVFVDSDRESWNLDPDLLEQELAQRAESGRMPAAVVTVDLYGQACDYNRIEAICEKYDVVLIEDAAEGLGARYAERAAGSFGRCAILSFNGNKIITAGGGGMFVCDDQELADRVRYLSTQARKPAPHYQHVEAGFNYRLSNVLAALGRAQLADLAERVARRRQFNEWYREVLADVPGFEFMPEADDCFTTFWLTCVTIDPAAAGVSREDVRVGLDAADIESRPVWKPMHLQPLFADAQSVLSGVSDDLFARGLCLPSGSGMSDSEFERVVDNLRKLIPALGG